MGKRTKIIATLGPATCDDATLFNLFQSGVNVVRLNCSHGSSAERAKLVKKVRTIAKENGWHIGILFDLQGPKIRVGSFEGGGAKLVKGKPFVLKTKPKKDALGNDEWVGLVAPNILSDIKPKQTLLLDDGQIHLKVETIEGSNIVCKIKQGGILSDHKGINVLGGGLSCPSLMPKDIEDLQDAVKAKTDFLAISFVKDAKDIAKVRSKLPKNSSIKIIAKIERKEAIDDLDAIIEASNGIMVARGDLALEVGDAEVPILQKNMVKKARDQQKPVIVATHMMQSMIEHPNPTRAEVSDVANAILDGTDAVMLSAETATGKHPIKVIKTVSDICKRVEKYSHKIYDIQQSPLHRTCSATDEAIAATTMYTARHYPLVAIIALTESGKTALRLSRFSTQIPIFALSRTQASLQQMTLFRNITPVFFDVTAQISSEVNQNAMATLVQQGLLKSGDLIGLTKGSPIGIAGHTNSFQILTVPEDL